MSDDLVKMARLAQRDERMSTGALYGDLADRIEELEAKLAQQDDLVQAAVAAALRQAAEVANCSNFRHEANENILALITEDAQAALDRVVAAERKRAYEELIETVQYLAAAIRKGGE